MSATVEVKGCTRNIHIKDVFHVPKLHTKLLSMSKLVLESCKVHFSVLGCIIRASNREVMVVGSQNRNLYQITFKRVVNIKTANVAQLQLKQDMVEVWH